jgi:hypothetical protein
VGAPTKRRVLRPSEEYIAEEVEALIKVGYLDQSHFQRKSIHDTFISSPNVRTLFSVGGVISSKLEMAYPCRQVNAVKVSLSPITSSNNISKQYLGWNLFHKYHFGG